MLSRFLLLRSLPSRLRTLTLIPPPKPPIPSSFLRPFSTSNGDHDGGNWKFTPDPDDSIFPAIQEEPDLFGITEEVQVKEEVKVEEEWKTAEGYKPWSLDEGNEDSIFDVGGEEEVVVGEQEVFGEMAAAEEEERVVKVRELEEREKELLETLKGPNRAFGDLITASGITEEMIDSLILLKDVRGIQGLPPLSEIEDRAVAGLKETSARTEIERQKQEEISKARVKQVDDKGRAYGTGRRKCSIARVWIQPTTDEWKFIVNGKQFDTYFTDIDHRSDLLRPFTVTNTLGQWNIDCTVKGGGVSGQVGAVRLGISRALQNMEPNLREYLKPAGFMKRDPRVVERKKYGKAKARKSFAWVKR